MEGVGDVPMHGDVNVVVVVVPLQSHTAVKGTSGVGGDGIDIAKCIG